MGAWSFYFLAKLFLFARGAIGLHLGPNLLFAGFLLVACSRFPRWLRWTLAFPLAFALLWYDSFLPPFWSSFLILTNPSTAPTPTYMFAFLENYWSTPAAAGLLVIGVLCVLAVRFKAPLGVLSVVGLLAAGAVQLRSPLPAARTIDEQVQQFFAQQALPANQIRLTEPSPDSRPFDIVLLHVCSVSWADLQEVGLTSHPLFSEFDLLLTRFNSVTSYSGPATLRLLRSTCGQVPHDQLYARPPEDCSLFASLEKLGYRPSMLFNHQGSYSTQMAKEAMEIARAPALEDIPYPAPESLSFDGSPMYNNFERLKLWWQRRMEGGAPRALLYYNSVSLHAGGHAPQEPGWWKRDPVPYYRQAAQRAFDDYRKFFELLRQSGRDVLVVFVPEHGAALVGNRLQARDLREIPLPQITRIPVGFKWIGRAGGPARRIDRPTSYTAIAQVIRQALLQRDLDTELIETPFLADTERARVSRFGDDLYYQWTGGSWTKLDRDLYPAESF